MHTTQHTKGYSLVEVLVAIAILMIAIVGPMTIASKGLQSAYYAREQNTAFFLAQEGVEAVLAIRNDGVLEYREAFTADPGTSVTAWDWIGDPNLAPCFTGTGCNIDFRDGTPLNNIETCNADPTSLICVLHYDDTLSRARYQLTSGDESAYRRVIKLSNTDAKEVAIESTVSWNSGLFGNVQSVTLRNVVFNLYE